MGRRPSSRRPAKHAPARRKPGEPARIDPKVLEVRQRVAEVRDMLAGGIPVDIVLDWCEVETKLDRTRGILAKTWRVSRSQARKYVDRALESIGSEDGQPEDRKRARNRALTTLIVQRLMKIGSTSSLSAALRGADQLCKIDGSYDPDSLGPPNPFAPATSEEAAMLIEHAAATLALARRRGVAELAAAAKPVIDVGAVDPEEVDDGPGVPADPERPRDAN